MQNSKPRLYHFVFMGDSLGCGWCSNAIIKVRLLLLYVNLDNLDLIVGRDSILFVLNILKIVNMKNVKSLIALFGVVAVILPGIVFADAIIDSPFNDVDQEYQYFTGIKYVYNNDIVGGYSDGTYRPDDLINRAEYVKVVVGALYESSEIDSCLTDHIDEVGLGTKWLFQDASVYEWYSKYLCEAKLNYLVGGYSDGTFRPVENISFVEAAKVATNLAEGELPACGMDSEPWYKCYVDKLASLNAVPDSIDSFDHKLTRGELAEIIWRLMDHITSQPSQGYGDLLGEGDPNAAFIYVTSPKDGSMLYEEPFYVKGNTSGDCSKIVVTATNDAYGIKDVYTLQNYDLGDTTFKYGVKHEWKNLDVGMNIYKFKAYCGDVNPETTVTYYYDAGGGVEMGKPVIYLYPENEQEVYVNVEPEGGVTVSEPALGKVLVDGGEGAEGNIEAFGWEVLAKPSGELMNLADGTLWSYLFWEGYSDVSVPSEGFVVEKDRLSGFFSEKLAYLGLNEKELKDFKEFWLQKLAEENGKYYLISFVPQSELDEHAPLTVYPVPDTVIRVYFDYKVLSNLDGVSGLSEQVLAKGPERKGFTLVEWGGSLYR